MRRDPGWPARIAVFAIFPVRDAAHAQTLQVTNEAGGIACYRPNDLLNAHGAIGFYNLEKIRALVVQDRCLVMRKHSKASLSRRQRIMGADVMMVKVRLRQSASVTHFALSLLKNFSAR